MKTQIILTEMILLMMQSIACMAGDFSEKSTNPPWQLVDSAGTIYIYDRWLPVDSVSKARERKSVFVVNCSIEQAFQIISNPEYTSLWMSGLEECKALKNCDDGKVVYSRYNLPWPFKKRELFSVYKDTATPEGILLSIDSIDDMKQKTGYKYRHGSIFLFNQFLDWQKSAWNK